MKNAKSLHVSPVLGEVEHNEPQANAFHLPYGESDSVASFFEAYHSQLVGYLAKKMPFDLAEDISQEIWLSLIKDQRKISQIEKPHSYLWGVAKYKRATAVDKLSNERMEIIRSFDEDGGDRLVSVSSVEEGYDEEELQREENGVLALSASVPFLEDLFSPAERVYWMLRTKFGIKPGQIARLTGRNTHTVSQTLSRLRDKIEEHAWLGNWTSAMETNSYQQARGLNLAAIPWFAENELPPMFQVRSRKLHPTVEKIIEKRAIEVPGIQTPVVRVSLEDMLVWNRCIEYQPTLLLLPKSQGNERTTSVPGYIASQLIMASPRGGIDSTILLHPVS